MDVDSATPHIFTEANVKKRSRGNKPESASGVAETAVGINSDVSASATADVSRLELMLARGPGFEMSLRASNRMKSARTQSILKG
ncbi:uncharacterized protein Z519_05514 [Cladophialophora bantiana CBS 173.52]|uniref:Uncharacterized protein n=1 Tax=Cladophialophora bantiana (strain ATCC 10958 / CBS 173.52 / CDC B-1940 / NIH 8579) TaxID=1442370 RepID=A0A0D2HLL3_CLAB1|nr:uncharacterized protein Z519_05514 [Cladophialophora bantiana CBS 173.52]KIW94198.1 hypothetical protein Z519_05514 [Cladophialophora bantiana CBS 173.52]